jgi:DnaJ-class molecular chaperone
MKLEYCTLEEREKEKVECLECKGTGREIILGDTIRFYGQCWKCNGHGRHDP